MLLWTCLRNPNLGSRPMISGSGAFHFAVQYSTITLGVKLSHHSIKLEVCNDHISTKPQCSNSSFSLTSQLRWTLFLCWYPLAKPVCALKGNKFLNFHLTAGHQEQWGIQCLPSIARITLAEPKQELRSSEPCLFINLLCVWIHPRF